MEIKTFDTVLTGMCDSFDTLISPKKISRSDFNVIYLIFKAIAKGYEVVNNACVSLSNKFDPARCDESDLESVAKIVGTERISGTGSGLKITVTNNAETAKTLLAGIYTYTLDDDTAFEFEVLSNRSIPAESSIYYIAMSQSIGSFPVTEQSSITVESVQPIDSNFAFSCGDNSALLGRSEETNVEFRDRIMNDTTRQSGIVELENNIKALPYIFDCKVKFNDTANGVAVEDYTLPPFTAVIFYSGEVKSDIAKKIAEKIICPTLQTDDSVAVDYESDIFVNGKHTYYINPFKKTQYSVEVIYHVNDTYANDYDTRNNIRKTLMNKFVGETHQDYIREDDFYNAIKEMNISGIDLLGVNLKYGGNRVNYITVPVTRIPELTEVTFVKE